MNIVKLRFVSLLLVAFAFACTPDENLDFVPSDPDLEIAPGASSTTGINERIFSVLNLDYPGLESAKALYEAGDTVNAAKAIQTYYRTRPVLNPFVNLLATTVTAEQTSIASQATVTGNFCFKVGDYVDSQGHYYSFKDEETGEVDWTYRPEGVGEDFDAYLHRHEWMLPQAMVFKSSANTKYINGWIKAYFTWLDAYPCPEDTSSDVAWSGVAPALRAIDQMSLMYYYLPHSYFKVELLMDFLIAFDQHIKCVIRNYQEETAADVRLIQAKAIAFAGMLMPEFVDSPQWYQTGTDSILEQLDEIFDEDGVHNQIDLNKHVESLDDFIEVCKVAQFNGYFSEFSPEYTQKLGSAIQFVLNIMYPNYTFESINESESYLWNKLTLTEKFKKYLELFPQNETLKWLTYSGASGKMPITSMFSYPKSGLYVMKNGWTQNSMMLIHKNTAQAEEVPGNHSDNGNISLYMNGRDFLPDAGRGAASHTEHNTVVKDDDETPVARQGRLLKTETFTGYELIVTENASYPDLNHRRAIFLVDGKFFVIVDEAYGSYVGNVNVNFNLWGGYGDAPGNPVSGLAAVLFDDYSSEGAVCGVHSNFEDKNNLLIKTYSETSQDFTFNMGRSNFSNGSGVQTSRWCMGASVAKTEDKAARFVTILLPFADVDEFDALTVSAMFADNPNPDNAGTFHGNDGAAVKVDINGKEYSLSYNLN